MNRTLSLAPLLPIKRCVARCGILTLEYPVAFQWRSIFKCLSNGITRLSSRRNSFIVYPKSIVLFDFGAAWQRSIKWNDWGMQNKYDRVQVAPIG